MANPSPFKAIETPKTKSDYKIVDRKKNKVVLATDNSLQASRFLGAYDLYVFHVKNGHRKHRFHERYDLYIDNEFIKPINAYLNDKAIVLAGTTIERQNSKSIIKVISVKYNKEHDYYDTILKINDLPERYFYFTGKVPPNEKNVFVKAKKFIDSLK